MTNVLIVGASGMLGSMVVDVLSRDRHLNVTATARDRRLIDHFQKLYPAVAWAQFRFDQGPPPAGLFDGQNWIVNAIGITKPLIRDDDAAQIETAISVNSLLPHEIGRQALRVGARVLQIATDCVYSGAKGSYVENDLHDALDVYGKTKSLGETYQPAVHHLRCSIIGPEPKDFKFLIEWFRRQPQGAQLNGFTNHNWNGVTTLHLARLFRGLIRNGMQLPHLQHVVPAGALTKAEMLHEFAEAYCRPDISISDVEAKSVIDRTLATHNDELNRQIWQAAGYQQPPTVSEMIHEVARYDYSADVMSARTGAPA
jgi:dTDP-4-dehydrorhamnose reductase